MTEFEKVCEKLEVEVPNIAIGKDGNIKPLSQIFKELGAKWDKIKQDES